MSRHSPGANPPSKLCNFQMLPSDIQLNIYLSCMHQLYLVWFVMMANIPSCNNEIISGREWDCDDTVTGRVPQGELFKVTFHIKLQRLGDNVCKLIVTKINLYIFNTQADGMLAILVQQRICLWCVNFICVPQIRLEQANQVIPKRYRKINGMVFSIFFVAVLTFT